MKLKTTIAAAFACTLSFLPAQDAAPEKPAEKEAVKEVKPETPLEERAFKMFDIVTELPDIFGSVKDEDSLAKAQTKLDALVKKLEAEATELKKLPAPSNEDRKKLEAKMEVKEKAMTAKMEKVMEGMLTLDPALGEKVGQMFMTFGAATQKLQPTFEKYFEPDAEEGGE